MDAVDVQDFLLTTTEENESIFMETDKIFENKTTDDSSMYFSINDDTLSNKIVDDLQRLERTLTDEQSTQEMSSVISATMQEEESFQQNLNLPLKTFPGLTMNSQCSTPKLETPAPHKTPGLGVDLKLDASLSIPDLVLPLTTVLQKLEGKKKVVTIVEEENKENVADDAKPITEDKPVKAEEKKAVQPKKVTMRKALIPPKTTRQSTVPSSTLNARRSVRMSVVPSTFKSSRLTVGVSSRIGKINSPSGVKRSPKTTMKSLAPTVKTTSRLTMTASASATKPATATSSSSSTTTAPVEKKPSNEPPKANNRLSRIPPTTTVSSHPRPVFSCTTCKKTFHLKSTLITHQKMHLPSTGTTGPATGPTITGSHFKCSYCDKDFEKEVGLRNHVERYCEKVPVAEKRKLNGSHNRTRTRTTSSETHLRDRSKRDKSTTSSRVLESTTSSVGSEASIKKEASTKKEAPAPAAAAPQPPPASGLSPRKPIKSILAPHSGIKFSANKPIKCFQCKISFHKYVDFHAHVDEVHPQPL